MKVIITENQYKYLVENINPCPEGKKEDELITLDDVKNGKIIPKGYCNSKPGSALVKIQRLLQDKGYLDTKSNNGYYGDKTQKAIQKLWNPDTVKGIEIGKKTLEKLEGLINIGLFGFVTSTNIFLVEKIVSLLLVYALIPQQ